MPKCLLAAVLFLLATATSIGFAAQSQPNPQNAKPASPQSQPPGISPEKAAVQAANEVSVAALLEKIKGQEQEPASKVFKNVKWLTDVPAARFLNIMNIGYSRALGVKCEHCHNESDYSSDEKRPKRAAREMQVMHRSANDQLAKMQNLQPKPEGGHFINCTTCHRGMTDPTKPLPPR